MYQLISLSQKLLLVYYFVISKKISRDDVVGFFDENCPLVISSLNAKNAIVCQFRICVTTLNNNERGNQIKMCTTRYPRFADNNLAMSVLVAMTTN